MAGRSYLTRIAQPLAPGEPTLTPLRVPVAEAARPQAMLSVVPGIAQREATTRPARLAAPTSVADPVKPTSTIRLPESDQAVPTELSAATPAAARLASVATADPPAPPQPDIPEPAADDARAPAWSPHRADTGLADRAPAPVSRPSIHIGTVEVRTRPAQAPASSPQQAASPSVAPAALSRTPAAAPSRLSRGLVWRYGLMQS
jgi:hypothetical protein